MNSSNSNKKITKSAASTKPPAKTHASEEAKVALPKSRSRTNDRPGTKTGKSDVSKRAPSSKAVESEALPSKSPAGRKTTKSNTTTTTAARGRQAVTQMSELE